MGRTWSIAVAVLALAGAAKAHPHTYVDQQVQLSLGLDMAEVTIVIVPSIREGKDIHAHIDLDGDGRVSSDEASILGAEILASARLEVDGEAVALVEASAMTPDADRIIAGSEAITIKAKAGYSRLGPGAHQITFDIAYGAFSHKWFVQPFYYPDLAAAAESPTVQRPNQGNRVTVRFRSAH